MKDVDAPTDTPDESVKDQPEVLVNGSTDTADEHDRETDCDSDDVNLCLSDVDLDPPSPEKTIAADKVAVTEDAVEKEVSTELEVTKSNVVPSSEDSLKICEDKLDNTGEDKTFDLESRTDENIATNEEPEATAKTVTSAVDTANVSDCDPVIGEGDSQQTVNKSVTEEQKYHLDDVANAEQTPDMVDTSPEERPENAVLARVIKTDTGSLDTTVEEETTDEEPEGLSASVKKEKSDSTPSESTLSIPELNKCPADAVLGKAELEKEDPVVESSAPLEKADEPMDTTEASSLSAEPSVDTITFENVDLVDESGQESDKGDLLKEVDSVNQSEKIDSVNQTKDEPTEVDSMNHVNDLVNVPAGNSCEQTDVNPRQDVEMIDISVESQPKDPFDDLLDMPVDDIPMATSLSSAKIDASDDSNKSSRLVAAHDGKCSKESSVVGDAPAMVNGVGNSRMLRKRLSDSRTDVPEGKKLRPNPPSSSAAAVDKPGKNKENVQCKAEEGASSIKPPALSDKKPTNLERAIDRVASGGKKKREREICEILSQLEEKTIEKLTAGDLEELVVHLMLQAILQRSEVGHLKDLTSTLATSVKKWKNLATNLAKQVQDLQMVFKRMSAHREKNGHVPAPMKVTRSVGLQVGGANGTTTGVSATSVKTISSRPMTPQARLAAPQARLTAPQARPTAPQARPTAPQARPTAPPPARRTGSGILTNRNSASPMNSSVLVKQSPTVNNSSPNIITVVPDSLLKMSPAKVAAVVPSGSHVPQPAARRTAPLQTSGRQVSGLIDLTDEDDRTKTNGSTTAGRIVNQMAGTKQGNTLRLVSPNKLSASATPNGANPRLAFTVTNSTGAGAQKSVMYGTTTIQQQPGMATSRPKYMSVSRPMVTTNQQQATSPTPARGPTPNVRRVFPMTSRPSGVQSMAVRPSVQVLTTHPAPLPPPPQFYMPNKTAGWKQPPPMPELKISKCDNRQQGIILSWKMDSFSDLHEPISNYQLFAYQESTGPPSTSMWKRVGEVKSMPLPMACTLTQFSVGNTYHFAVRALDVKGRTGPFSLPGSILLPVDEM